MTYLASDLSNALAELLHFLLLSLVIFLPSQTLGSLRLRIGIVITLIFFQVVIVFVDLENLVYRSVEELSIMRDHHNRSVIAREVCFKPFHAG